MSYTNTEIKSFEQKDKRICKQAILKKLIEKLPLEDVYEVNGLTELAEKYVTYVYGEQESVCNTGSVVSIDWEEVAGSEQLLLPTEQNIKILDSIWNECKDSFKCPVELLLYIIEKYGKYPTKEKSVDVIVKNLNN